MNDGLGSVRKDGGGARDPVGVHFDKKHEEAGAQRESHGDAHVLQSVV